MKSLVKFYLSLVLRRLPLMVLAIVLVAGVGIVVAFQLPDRYSASARLLVESSQIPDNLARTTVDTSSGEQLEVIQQRLMTRANLLAIARQFDVFEDIDSMTPDQIVAGMRSATSIRRRSGRDRATLLTISFRADRARTAADVANEYVTIILDENIRYRTGRAEGAEDFFQQEVARLSNEIDIQRDRILRFKQDNADALPDNLQFRLRRQTDLQNRISDAQRRRSDLLDQKERLVAVFNSTGSLAGLDQRDLTPEQRQLRSLQAELNAALAVYSETNPRVRILQTRISQLESAVSAQSSTGEGSGGDSPSLLDVEVSRIEGEIESLDDLIEETETALTALSQSIDRTPANSIALDALERDYSNIQSQYNEAVRRLAQAQTGERIELLSKGERITVVEQATVPNRPSSPDRPRIAQASLLLGFGVAGGIFILLELLNNAIRRPQELTTALGITPFAVLPYIHTKSEKRRRRSLMIGLAVALVLAIAGTLAAIQIFYLPLDIVLERLLKMVGLDG